MQFLLASQYWSPAKIREWQDARVREVVAHAYTTTKGYREIYDAAGLKPQDIRGVDDLRHLPFVTKEILRDRLEDFSSSAVSTSRRLYRTTGGSTGIPFGFYLTEDNIGRELAFLHLAWRRAGWDPSETSALLRGAFIGTEKGFWEYDSFLRELRLSSYYLSESTYSAYKALILKKGPAVLQAYPSAAHLLSDLVLQNGDAGIFPFRRLFLGSENLYDWQREIISRAFPGATIYSWYGHAEQVLFAPACEHSSYLHLDPFYGAAQILTAEGEEAGAGGTGELVGTSFWNVATPFIRYRTMDIARRGPDRCAKCGRACQLLEQIEGRLQEFIVTGSGRFISMTAINMHSNIFDHVRQFQFHQQEKGRVTLRLVRASSFTDADAEGIVREIQRKLGDDTTLALEYVDGIEKPRSGKFRFLMQELPVRYGEHD